jgi:hypothetical protein
MDGRRRSRSLSVTENGLSALRAWITRIDRESTAATYDPVRTRLGFMDVVPLGARASLVARAIAESRKRLEELDGAVPDQERLGTPEGLALLGARRELEARVAWLVEVRDRHLAGGLEGSRRDEEPIRRSRVHRRMDITLELHCDKCGSANLSLPPREDAGASIACNDCGEPHGTLAELKDELFSCALEQSSETLREGLERITSRQP